MNLDMWFRDDIANILKGIVVAVMQSGSNQSTDWQAGFVAGITAAAASFGIAPQQVTGRGECIGAKMDGPFRLERASGNAVRLQRDG